MNPIQHLPRTDGPRRILIVDDVQTNVRLLRAYLGPEGYEVETASGGEEALERIRERSPDLVLLDVMMPRVSGFDVCREIKGNEATQKIPVILVTSLTSIDDKEKGQEVGADDFISKPFQRAELLVRVRSMLRIKDLHDRLGEKIEELERAKVELRRLADTDGLTGLKNKRFLERFLEKELARARRYQRPMSLVVLDIDHFKRFNDTWGHQRGDRLLQRLAETLRGSLRNIDLAARFGGEEFVLVLIETDREDAVTVAAKVRERIGRGDLGETSESGGPTGQVTASMGIAVYPEDGETRDLLIEAADRRMYLAKQRGRDLAVATDE